jgi:hypothetical protein
VQIFAKIAVSIGKSIGKENSVIVVTKLISKGQCFVMGILCPLLQYAVVVIFDLLTTTKPGALLDFIQTRRKYARTHACLK